MMKKNVLPVLLLAAWALMAAAGGVNAANTGTAPRQARVAGGSKVPLVSSARTAGQWSAQRPGVRSLRPKARSNVE